MASQLPDCYIGKYVPHVSYVLMAPFAALCPPLDPLYMAMAEGFGGVDAAMNGVKGPGNNSPLKEVERVRSQFPETWLWTNTSVGYSYNATIPNYFPVCIFCKLM